MMVAARRVSLSSDNSYYTPTMKSEGVICNHPICQSVDARLGQGCALFFGGSKGQGHNALVAMLGKMISVHNFFPFTPIIM